MKEPSHYHQENMRATHSYIIEKLNSTDCHFSNTKLTVEHMRWTCNLTEQDRIKMKITKDEWNKGREGVLKLIEHLKRIGFYNKI
jgi:hypothetical protein